MSELTGTSGPSEVFGGNGGSDLSSFGGKGGSSLSGALGGSGRLSTSGSLGGSCGIEFVVSLPEV